MLIDLIIVIMLALGVSRGFRSGLIKTLMSLVAWLLALVLGVVLASPLSVLFVDLVSHEMGQRLLVFGAVVLSVVMVGHVVIWFSQKTLKLLRLTLLDKLLGGALGGIRALLKVLIMLIVLSPILIHTQTWQNAHLAQQILPLAPVAKTLALQAWQQTSKELF